MSTIPTPSDSGCVKMDSQDILASILDNVDLNNHGIVMLQENQIAEAIEDFSIGLRSVIDTIQSLSKQEQSHSTTAEGKCTKRGFPVCMGTLLISVDLPKSNKQMCCAAENGENDDNDGSDCRFSIYKRALKMAVDQPGDPEACCQFLCGVFLYNIGLANHLIAMNTGNSKMLNRALDFYSMAHRTVPNDCPPPPSPSRAELQGSNLALLAIANNVGQIHCVCGNRDKIQICADEMFDRLSFLLTASPVVSEEDNGCSDNNVDREEDYRILMLNASFFSQVGRMPAHTA